MPPAGTATALDLGCGYGPLALTLAHRVPTATVWAVDVNERAVELWRNAASLGLTNVRPVVVTDNEPFDAIPDDVRFDLIWSNSPIRIGKPALHSLLRRWLDRLHPQGMAVLVVQKHLGADSLQRWLIDEGHPTERYAARSSYRLLTVHARPSDPQDPAMTRNLGSTELKRLHRSWRDRSTSRLALLLDGVQTPYNVGSILRTAAAYRVNHLWLVDPTASPTDAKTQKTALGSQKYLTWTITASVPEAAAEITQQGYTLVGVELADGALPLFDLDLAHDVCLAVGHEDRGLSADGLAACDDIGYLPLVGRIGSLNVATAASMAMYEARRQAWQSPGKARTPDSYRPDQSAQRSAPAQMRSGSTSMRSRPAGLGVAASVSHRTS